MGICIFFLILLYMATLGSSINNQSLIISVLDLGAVGDGTTDDSQVNLFTLSSFNHRIFQSQIFTSSASSFAARANSEAFTKAWGAVCGSTNSGVGTLSIPAERTFLLKSLVFKGPCKPPTVHVHVEGNIVNESNATYRDYYMGSWIVFTRIDGLKIDGSGLIDGRGKAWWETCGPGLKFDNCNNLQVSGLKLVNSPARFISVSDCKAAIFSDLVVSNPPNSPNTDGIDITHSRDVQILDSQIGVGDDCIAILGGCSYVNITRVTCGPGHGISIGSMGKRGDDDRVEEVHVKDCNFTSTLNGAHIKTWQGGSGYARKITFENIILSNTSNPINIDQFYCPRQKCTNQTKAVNISDISFVGFRGSSFTEAAIHIGCSQTVGCTGIILDRINITSSTPQRQIYSTCTNAHGTAMDTFPTVNCLLP